jgi:hypothetical protein
MQVKINIDQFQWHLHRLIVSVLTVNVKNKKPPHKRGRFTQVMIQSEDNKILFRCKLKQFTCIAIIT